jgi:hypothetical protein
VDAAEPLPEPTTKDLEDPAFQQYLATLFPSGKVRPDDQDFDRSLPTVTGTQRAEAYRIAQAKMMIRLYRQWRGSPN